MCHYTALFFGQNGKIVVFGGENIRLFLTPAVYADYLRVSPFSYDNNRVSRAVLLVGNDDGNGNTDTIIVGKIDTVQHKMDFVSIPRDTLVNISWNIRKINAVYWGTVNSGGVGIDGLRQQVKNLLGFDVDCYAVIDLDVFIDTVDALGELARYNIVRRRELDGDFDIIGLTGSVGKTTTKDLLSSLLATVGPTVAPVGSFNNEIGLPLTALRVDEHTRFFVAEMGASHIGEIARLTRIAPPNTAIVLKVGVAHLGEFGSRERIAQAKSEIVQGLLPGGTAVLNADDEHVVPMAGLANGDVLWFGLGSSQEPEVRAIDVTADRSDHAEFTLVDADGNHTPVHLGIPGRHNVMNALAAATVAMRYGMAPETVARILASQHIISPHRMALSTVNREGTSFTLIDDSFNANPDSMKAGLNGLKAWNSNDGKEPFRVALLGAMLELGADETALHTSIGTYADELGIDAIIAVGSAQDQHLDALAQALADGARQSQSASVDCVHDIDAAEQLVIDLARNHPDAGTAQGIARVRPERFG